MGSQHKWLYHEGSSWPDGEIFNGCHQRVIQRAVVRAQSSGRDEVTGANVLVAIFSESEAHAAYLPQEQGMTRHDAVNYVSHGIEKVPLTPLVKAAIAARRANHC